MSDLDNVAKSFSLEDFLAYLFPGWIFLLGIHIFLSMLFDGYGLLDSGLTWFVIVCWIVGGYFLGVISSLVARPIEMWQRSRDPSFESPTTNRYLKNYSDKLSTSFNSVFGHNPDPSNNAFYAIRAFVRLKAPSAVVIAADRQNSLRQIRRNTLVPVVVLIFDGCIWSLIDVCEHPARLVVLLASIIFGMLVLGNLYVGMKQNREREVRDYCLAFIGLAYGHEGKSQNQV